MSEIAEPAKKTDAADASPVLAVKNIEVVYDSVILALRGVSLDVPKGKIVALLQVFRCADRCPGRNGLPGCHLAQGAADLSGKQGQSRDNIFGHNPTGDFFSEARFTARRRSDKISKHTFIRPDTFAMHTVSHQRAMGEALNLADQRFEISEGFCALVGTQRKRKIVSYRCLPLGHLTLSFFGFGFPQWCQGGWKIIPDLFALKNQSQAVLDAG